MKAPYNTSHINTLMDEESTFNPVMFLHSVMNADGLTTIRSILGFSISPKDTVTQLEPGIAPLQ